VEHTGHRLFVTADGRGFFRSGRRSHAHQLPARHSSPTSTAATPTAAPLWNQPTILASPRLSCFVL
jgi:hypothetical protein